MHALSLVVQWLRQCEEQPRWITVKAGGPLVVSRLLRWFNRGDLSLASAAASEVVLLFGELRGLLRCPLLFCSAPGYQEYVVDKERGQSEPGQVIAVTRQRLLSGLLQGEEENGRQTSHHCRIPLTLEEVKKRAYQRFEKDEAKVLRLLDDYQSVSSGIFRRLEVDRELVQQVLAELSYSRALQATFCSIICATRFKYCHKGRLLPTVCQYCGSVDSLEHLMACVRIGPMPPHDSSEEGIENRVRFLVELAVRAHNVNPGYPVPCNMEDVGEVELFPQTESEESAEELELAFEGESGRGDQEDVVQIVSEAEP